MRVYFIGIGGTAIGPLALMAKQAGYRVAGSDKQDSQYIRYLKSQGISDVNIGSDDSFISRLHQEDPIDLIIYSSAVSIENKDHPELEFAKKHGIRNAKRDELINRIIKENKLKLIAVAGTHGKTTTTAMAVWLFKQLGIDVSYSVGAKISFGEMGHFSPKSEYFIYECDEFDRNFLAFSPYLSLVTGVDYDHQEHYPTREDYNQAFRKFIEQSEKTFIWKGDADRLGIGSSEKVASITEKDYEFVAPSLPGKVNRQDAALVAQGVFALDEKKDLGRLSKLLDKFPGVSRRFERIADNLYSDYAHTIPKIKGCLQLAGEVSDNIVVVYEPLTNRRQHFIKDEYKNLFKGVDALYWVPSYLAREDPAQKIITPDDFIDSIETPNRKEAAELDDELKESITRHLKDGDLVVCLSGGGGGSLDEWIRSNFQSH